MKNMRLALGGITDNVYVGRVNKVGTEWIDKQDITNDFLACVIDKFVDNETTITSGTGEKFSVIVARLNNTGRSAGMSRLSEIENEIDRLLSAQSDWTPLMRSLATKVDELHEEQSHRAVNFVDCFMGVCKALDCKPSEILMMIDHMRDEHKDLADKVDKRDAVITIILEMLRPIPEPILETEIIQAQWRNQNYLYARACEIAGRTE